MIASRLKYLCSLASTIHNPLQAPLLHVQPTKIHASRAEVAIFTQYALPQLIAAIDSLPLFKQIASYNPALTNGGNQLQQFPLVKLLHMGLKRVEGLDGDGQFWGKFERIIKTRLHRCRVEQHMRLLYIMLRIWPLYRFNSNFISSICLALKKEIPIMNDQQLKLTIRVTAADILSPQRYQTPILLSLQAAALNRVLSRWQQMQVTKKNASLEGLYSWVGLSAVLSLQNRPQESVMQERVVRLAALFSTIYHKATVSGIGFKGVDEQNLLLMMRVMGAFQSIYRYYQGSDAAESSWAGQFPKLKQSLITHTARTILRILQRPFHNDKINNLNSLLTLINKHTLENILTNDQHQHSTPPTQPYSHITKLVQPAFQDRTDTDLVPKLKLLLTLVQQQIVDWHLAKLHYDSLELSSLKESSLTLTLYLLQLQLYFYHFSDRFQPRPQTHRLITSFLSKNQASYRNLDWLAFHYLRLTITKRMNLPLLPHDGTLVQLSQQTSSLEHTLLSKILVEAKIADAGGLIEQERRLVQATNRDIGSLKKFFIQVRLHELQILQPIIAPFLRLPHFSNDRLKIAVNAYSEESIKSPAVQLEKRLLNEVGWKVVNLKMPFFVNLTTGERVSRISAAVEQQQRVIARKQQELLQ